MATAEWTVLEKLLLSQAVYKYGEDNWFQIARNLKHHALLDRPSDYFNQKNCSLQYYLMVEDLAKEKRNVFNQDMPVVVQIARQLYSTRLEELKKAINDDEEKFLTLVTEIDEIRAGKWDQKLLEQYQQQQQPATPMEGSPVAATTTNKEVEAEKQVDTTASTEISSEALEQANTAERPSVTESAESITVNTSPSSAPVDNVVEDTTLVGSDEKAPSPELNNDVSEHNAISNTPKAADEPITSPMDEAGHNIIVEEEQAKVEADNSQNEARDIRKEDKAPSPSIVPSTATTPSVTTNENAQQEETIETPTIGSSDKEEIDTANTTASLITTHSSSSAAKNIEAEEVGQQSALQVTAPDTVEKKGELQENDTAISANATIHNSLEVTDNSKDISAEAVITAAPQTVKEEQTPLTTQEQFSQHEQTTPTVVTTTPAISEHSHESTAQTIVIPDRSTSEGMEWEETSGKVLKRQADSNNIVDEPEPKRLRREDIGGILDSENASSTSPMQQQQNHVSPSERPDAISDEKQDQSMKIELAEAVPIESDSIKPAIPSITTGNYDYSLGEGSESVAATESNAPTPITNISTATPSAAATPTASAATTPHATCTTPTTERKPKINFKDDPRHKSWQKNVNLLWREIANHKNGAMFMNPIKENIAPRYYEIVKRPMDLKTIKNRIRDGLICNTTEFERDVVLMLNNSLMYNKEGTEVYLLAREMLDDALEQIRVFKTADTDSSASSHTRAASMAAKAERRKSAIPD